MKSKKQIISLLLLLHMTIHLLCPRFGWDLLPGGLRVQELSLVDVPAQVAVKEAQIS